MQAEYNKDISMKKTFETILLVLCIIGLLIIFISYFL
jgi:hypothetical protein